LNFLYKQPWEPHSLSAIAELKVMDDSMVYLYFLNALWFFDSKCANILTALPLYEYPPHGDTCTCTRYMQHR